MKHSFLCLLFIGLGSISIANTLSGSDGCPVGNYDVGDGTCCPYGKTGSGGECYSHFDSICGSTRWHSGLLCNGQAKCCPYGTKDCGGSDCDSCCNQ